MRCSWSADFTWTMSVWSRSVIRISRISLLRGDLGDFYERMCEGNTRMMERIEMETNERSPRLSLLYIYIYLQKETNQRRATERGGQRERRGVTSWWHAVSRRGLCPLRGRMITCDHSRSHHGKDIHSSLFFPINPRCDSSVVKVSSYADRRTFSCRSIRMVCLSLSWGWV